MSDELKKKGESPTGPEKVPQTAVDGRLEGLCRGCGVEFIGDKPNQEFCRPSCQRRFQSLASKLGQEALAGGVKTVSQMKGLCRGATLNRRPKMKDTRIEKSPRLMVVFEILNDCKPHTTLEVQKKINRPGAATIISGIRWNLHLRSKKELPQKFQQYRFLSTRYREGKKGQRVCIHQLEVVR